MRTLNKRAEKILETLTADMKIGQIRRIGEKGDAFMQVVVERLGERTFSVAHYYEQNGDLMPDPEMVFVRLTGAWLPIEMSDWSGHKVGARTQDEMPAVLYPSVLNGLVDFAGFWMANIKRQQDGLKNIPAATDR